jgi:DNA polymerase III epsilon subunit-like protein
MDTDNSNLINDEVNGKSLKITIPQGMSTVTSTNTASPGVNNASSSSRPCIYFAQGSCRFGSQCRFSHVASSGHLTPTPTINLPGQNSAEGSPSTVQTPPPPIFIQVPPGHPLFSIDVECVATGVQHNARAIAHIAVVDEWSRPVFNVYIKPDQPILSYITELTGLTAELLDTHGLPLGIVCRCIH